VPNGIVATTQNAYVKLRRFLVEDSLVAVVSLPAGVFKPYSGVKTSILLLDKKLARRTREILFLKIAADGFDLGDKRTPIEANDLPEAERVVKLWLAGKLNEKVETALAWKAVEKKELLDARDVPLSGDRFVGDGHNIEHGTEKARLVMSKEFFRKGWTNYELDGIVTRAVGGDQVLLPIWHNVTKKEVIEYSPSLADKLARSTATHTVEGIATEIIEVIKNPA
jgi:type I restriction-modification system DNA methylase subunit